MSYIKDLPKKSGTYIGHGLRRALSGWVTEDNGFSKALNTMGDRYAAMLDHHSPDLSDDEWHLVFCALSNHVHADVRTLPMVWAFVDDWATRHETDNQWGVDTESLVDRIRGLPYASQVAIIDLTERYWAMVQDVSEAAAFRAIVPVPEGTE